MKSNILLYSQKPTNAPYPDSYQSIPHILTIFYSQPFKVNPAMLLKDLSSGFKKKEGCLTMQLPHEKI